MRLVQSDRRAAKYAGLVNAVLRRFLRERAALLGAAQRTPSGRHNHPQWWIDRLKADWPEQWPALLEANDQRPPMTLRVNLRLGSVARYLARLDEVGIPAQALALLGWLATQPGFYTGLGVRPNLGAPNDALALLRRECNVAA